MCVCPSLLVFRFPNSPSCDPTIHSAMKPALIWLQKSCLALVRVPVICVAVVSFVMPRTCSNQLLLAFYKLIPVSARSEAWVCGRSLAGIVGSIPVGAMDVCRECCVLSGRGLCVGLITRPEESYRVWCVWVWSGVLDNEEALTHWGMLRYKKVDVWYSCYMFRPFWPSSGKYSTRKIH